MTKQNIICQTEDGVIVLRQHSEFETFWITKKKLAEFFDVNLRAVNEHIGTNMKSWELDEISTIQNFWITADDRKRHDTEHYNFDSTMNVGCRVNYRKAAFDRVFTSAISSDFITKKCENGIYQ